jgi:DNA-binding LacI/PurR family transcriptional regulator
MRSEVRVHDNMSVIRYDESFAATLTPPLTSIAQPIDELGRNVVTLAREAIA